MESQYASILSFSASLSTHQAQAAAPSLNLSRASPFGSLSHISSRRTFAYLIATLNASHPDYDFSHLLRPSDFRREKSVKRVINTLDTTLNNLRPKPSIASPDEPAHWSTEITANTTSNPQTGAVWSPRMWHLIDKEMSLKECSIYCYSPEEDPYDEDEGSLWSFNYFFFNKSKKRVCYLYLRGTSILESASGLKTPVSMTPGGRAKRGLSMTWSVASEETSQKRARFWLGDRAGDAELVRVDDDDKSLAERTPMQEAEALSGDDEPDRMLAFSSTDEAESPCRERERSGSLWRIESDTSTNSNTEAVAV